MKIISFFKTAICLLIVSQTVQAQDKYQSTLIEPVSIISDVSEVELHFLKKGNYKVFEGTSPETINWKSAVNVQNNNKMKFKRNSLRPYYAVVTESKDTLMVAERKIPFEKVMNFRDLGGLKTKDNRYISWGNFYRADALNDIASDEFEFFNALGIKKVFDLRSDSEVSEAPNHLPSQVTLVHFPIFDDIGSSMFEGIEEKMKDGTLTKQDAAEILIVGNRYFADQYAGKFKELLNQILKENTPIVYHCSAGKDRTGFTSALILSVLNVDRETILDEYTMTNYYTKDKIARYVSHVQKENEMFANMNVEAIEVLMGVDRTFLEAAFEIIDSKYGGIDAYLKNQMGISDEMRKEFIQKYTYSF